MVKGINIKKRVAGIAASLCMGIFIILTVTGCCPILNQFSKEKIDEDLVVSYGQDEVENVIEGSRSFYMGFTPFPFDFTQHAVDFTYSNINHHSDLVCHHFDGGIPWTEALEGDDYSDSLYYELRLRSNRTGDDKKIYLALTPLSTYRDSLAEYWGEGQDMEIPESFKDKSFDDKEVIDSYLNFCSFMIEKFEPDYLAYGIEANMLALNSPKKFDSYLKFLDKVYYQLKEDYGSLPIFLTFQLETYINNKESQEVVMKRLAEYTDYVAISSYPFGNFEDPEDIPEGWFEKLSEIMPGKPVAVAETSFIAEDLHYESSGYTIEGSEEAQFGYLDFLLSSADSVDARFLVWFAVRDYDQLWESMEEAGADEIFKSWRDSGLIDEDGNARKSLSLWDQWLSLPLR